MPVKMAVAFIVLIGRRIVGVINANVILVFGIKL